MRVETKKPEKISEIILITECEDGSPYIAPFGVRERDGLILIAPFRPSISLDNLLNGRRATINTSDDVRVFAGALTGRRHWMVQDKAGALVLESALAYKTLKLEKVEDDTQRPQLYLKVIREEMLKPFQGYNRAQAAVLELCVLVSRLNMLPIEKISSEMDYLRIAIEKTAGDIEQEAWGWLVEAVENHRAHLSGGNIA
jgi:uncharacterized protein